MAVNIIITMAGFGRRFVDAGYAVPKYRIYAHGQSLFAWSMLSLRAWIESGANFIFIVRRADDARTFINDECARLGIRTDGIIELDSPTDGQATTAMLARNAISDRSSPILIYNIDTFVHPAALDPGSVRGDGWLPCFPGPGDHWSFAAADSSGRVSEVREKRRISNHATVGLYHFASFDLYAAGYEQHYAEAARVEAGERYIAPIYNSMISAGNAVYLSEIPIDAVIPLGTPADMEAFLLSDPPML